MGEMIETGDAIMERHTSRLVECQKCFKNNYFLIQVVEKDGQYFYLTQCPKCKHYEECRKITENEYKIYSRNA